MSVQSASFPGNESPSRADFLLVRSLAFLAASLALWDNIDFSIIKSEEFDSSKWLNDVKSKNVIINVIASSTCPHCHNYNPIIESVASNYKIKLYFIEVDKLENEEYISYINSISIPGYKGYVPYTFITYDGEVVSENVGELDRNETDKLILDVLKQYKWYCFFFL